MCMFQASIKGLMLDSPLARNSQAERRLTVTVITADQ